MIFENCGKLICYMRVRKWGFRSHFPSVVCYEIPLTKYLEIPLAIFKILSHSQCHLKNPIPIDKKHENRNFQHWKWANPSSHFTPSAPSYIIYIMILKEERHWKLICYYGNYVWNIVMYGWLGKFTKFEPIWSNQSKDSVCMIFSFVTIPCPTCDIILHYFNCSCKYNHKN